MAGKGDAWLPFYVADYLRDTMRLTTTQHGAYLLLLMAMWVDGGELPNDPAELAAIAKMSPADWRKASPVLMRYFLVEGDVITQKRMSAEVAKAQSISEKRREAGQLGGRPRKQTESKTKPNGFESPPIGKANGLQTGSQTETPARVALPSPRTTVSEPDGSDPALSEASASSSDRDPTQFELSGEVSSPPPAKPRRLSPTTAEIDAIWQITPRLGRERSGRKDLTTALTAAMRRGHDPADVRRGLERAYTSATYSGDHAKGVHRLIEADRWQSFVEPEPTQSGGPVEWTGPADLLAAIIAETDDGFARKYVVPSRWVNGPHRQIVCRNAFAADTLRKQAPEALRRFGATTVTEAETERAA